jgi:DNA-binding MarR family transcriptional regulator
VGQFWLHVNRELAERLQAKQHGVVSLVSRCQAAGLVKRNVSESDGRRVEVSLTGKGARCLAQLANLHRAELLSLQGEFTVPDLGAFDCD